jgi:PKD repeat protein
MKINFRQGLARYQSDALSTPIFLQRSSGSGDFVDLLVQPDPTIIVFAHREANYIVEEVRTVAKAWGPIPSSVTSYLFWDVNLLTGELSRGLTLRPPIFAGTPPTNPLDDQHWFDTQSTTMFVWNGRKWSERVRTFAGWLTAGSIIRTFPIGSQAGISGDFDGGNIVLDAYLKPLRQSDGTFVTTTAGLVVVNNSARRVRFETDLLSGMADEPIPAFSLVRVRAGRRILLNRSTDFMSRIAGIATETLDDNEVGYITSDGLVRNEAWSFTEAQIDRPVFSGPFGEVTLTPPTTGVLQVAGYVWDTDAIYVDVQPPIILDQFLPLPPAVDSRVPIADFSISSTVGNAPLIVNFTSMSLNNPDRYEWDFTNDGVVDSTDANPTHTFATPGIYTVRLRAINNFGFDDEIKVGVITVNQGVAGGAEANLGITISGPTSTLRNSSFQIGVTIRNQGLLGANSIVRVLTIPDVNGEQIQISGLAAGSSISRSGGRTLVNLPVLTALASGGSFGPTYVTITAPSRTSHLTIQGTVSSPDLDLTIGDNTTSLSVEVRP